MYIIKLFCEWFENYIEGGKNVWNLIPKWKLHNYFTMITKSRTIHSICWHFSVISPPSSLAEFQETRQKMIAEEPTLSDPHPLIQVTQSKDELQEWTGHSHWFSENLKLVELKLKHLLGLTHIDYKSSRTQTNFITH